MNKRLIFGIIILGLIGFFLVSKNLIKREREIKTVDVKRGTVFEEVLESGSVEGGEELKLSFKRGGRIEKIFVEVGEEVTLGQELAKLQTIEADLQLQEAQAAYELAEANLKKLLAGSTPQEIEIAQTQLDNAKIALNLAKENLENSYETALVVLDNSYIQLYNTLNFIKGFVLKYVNFYNDESQKITTAKEKIESAKEKAAFYLEIVRGEPKEENIEKALSTMKESSEIILDNLETIRKISEQAATFQNRISSSDKISLDEYKSNINQALSNIINAQEKVSLAKLNFDSTKTKLAEAEKRLELIKSPPRETDINLYRLQIKQAEIKIDLLKTQIEESFLKSPTKGKITKIQKREGEMVQPGLGEAVIHLLPEAPFQIKADIYEKEVVKMKIGNEVEISLVAFPGQIFKGRVSSIAPASKLKEGVVYYEAMIDFENFPEGLRPGMTADLKIITGQKENVLLIPAEAIYKKDGKAMVKVLKNGKIEEREIKTGLSGPENLVEVVSGLEEGLKIILE